MKPLLTLVFLFLLNNLSLHSQDLRFLEIDTTENVHTQFYSSSSTISSDEDEIFHSFTYNVGYDNFREILGKLKVNVRDQSGIITNQFGCEDSIFIRNILFKKDGGKVYLGRSLQNLHFMGLDTILEFSIFNNTRSFILETDAAGNTIDFQAFESIGAAALDKDRNELYFADNSNGYDSITIYKKDLNTKILSKISGIQTQQRNEELQVLLTDNYLYVSGGYLGQIATFGDSIIDSGFSYNTYVAQYTRAGKFNWVRIVEDITLFKSHLAPAPDQGVYFSAPMEFNTKIGNFQMNGSNWGSDFFLTRLDATGNFLWAVECPELKLTDFIIGSGDAIGSDADYNVYLAGAVRTGLQWDANTFIGRPVNDYISTMLVFNPDGQLIKYLVSTQDDYNRANSIEVKPNGNFILSGYFDQSIGFNDEVRNIEGSHDYLASFSNFVLNNNTVSSQNNSFDIDPNPCTGELNIIKLEGSSAEINIVDIYGRIVLKRTISGSESKINIEQLMSGIYFIKIDGYNTEKLVIR